MMRALATLLLLLLATAAGASPPLGDLTISASRVPDWYMPTAVDTSGWTVTNVNAADCADNATNDKTAIQNAINAAGASTVLQLQSSCTYNINGGGDILIEKDNIVLRGGGIGSTLLRLHVPEQQILARTSAAPGTATNWTAGFARGTTTVTVASASGITAGDWIRLKSAFPAELNVDSHACDPSGSWNNARNIYVAKVVSVDGNDIVIDRPLRNDHSNGPTPCQQTVREITPRRGVGIEALSIEFVDPAAQAPDWMFEPAIAFDAVVESWVQDVKIISQACAGTGAPVDCDTLQTQNVAINVTSSLSGDSRSARVLLDRVWILNTYFWPFNEQGIAMTGVESAVINSIFEGAHVDIKFEAGAQGNIYAYNFSRCSPAVAESCGAQAYGVQNSVFMHGLANESLVEGSDVELRTMPDTFWGSQQYRNTQYRNRISANPTHRHASHSKTANESGISVQCDVNNKTLSPYANWMLNVATIAHNGDTGDLDAATACTQFTPYNNYWLERNLIEGLLKLVPQTDTSSVNNVASSNGPTNWGLSFPASLVYTSKPSWWTISSPWPAIGGDVDVIGGAMRKLPAQCRYEGSTTGDCAPYTAPSTFLLPIRAY